MSLLNDMLRDLAHQHKPADALSAGTNNNLDLGAQEQRELFNQSSAAKPLPRSLIPSLIAFIAVLVVAVAWRYWVDIKPVHFLTSSEVNQVVSDPKVSPAGSVTQVKEEVKAEPELVARLAALETAVNSLADAVSDKTASTQHADEEDSTNETFVSSEMLEPVVDVSVSVKEPFVFDENNTDSSLQNGAQKVTNESAYLAISPNPKWQDEEHARQALELLGQGQVIVATEKLQSFIASAEQPRESIKVLLDIEIDQGNLINAEELLTKANYLQPVEQIYYQAKILVSQQLEDQAINLLEQHLADAERHENYRSLLAGLYQKNGMPLEAVNHYRRLLTVFGDKPAYWLGFALSQDALNQPQVALQAFQRVNQYADLPPQVRAYIQQRLAALQQ